MEVPLIFADMIERGANSIRDDFLKVLQLERMQGPLWDVQDFCWKLSKKPYFRCKDFDDLARLIFFNIAKGKSIDPFFRRSIFYFLKSIDPKYLVDFFSILDRRTFSRMRVIFSDDELLDILARMRGGDLFYAIENEGLRHEVERFIKDSFWTNF